MTAAIAPTLPEGAPADGIAVLIGSRPAEGYETLARLGIPFLWLVDPVDEPPASVPGAVGVVHVPFKSDPLSVLRVPLPDSVRAVLSFTEMGSLPAAMLSEALGLPSVPVRAVVRARNKLLMRRVLADTVPGPAFGVVGTDTPGDKDFPLIVKPAEGTGSQGIAYVETPGEYRDRAEELTGALWEQFLRGDEFSVEAVSFDGDHRILGITAKATTGQPHFVETGHEVPALLPPETEQAITECVRRCLDALEITLGASHTEVMVSDGRAFVIETHTRAGGDRIPLLTRLVSGADQYELAVRSVIPGAAPTPPEPAAYRHAAVHFLPWQDVRVAGVTGVEECRASDGVVEAYVEVADGDSVPVWRYSHERPGYLVVGADERAALRQRIRDAESRLHPRFG
ncbi:MULTISPECIES: ATP-grasp domain-containing protein [Streptomyces]|uniref:ATP-grasp domain-containing protein n=1 Tax=Streptomyces solicathayae TaxID=3081768 RepID=A0ABZ0M2K4_9ACTN|nr:ATP-grasp domain-containing protein [Streptomyces sp. HUAS YS2]WOX26006.1 ATP-grasp domain-containing protein [Streptomyces sp. HUAS YS2]